ncbi:MAG: response regulator [Arcobacteraceae bacterium]
MKKILSVDANLINSKIIEQDIKVYFDSVGEEFEFFFAQTPQHTLDIINAEQIDIIFLDISSKHYDGIKLLKYIKQQPVRQSKIVGVTVLDDHTFRFEALKYKVYRYIYKPYDNKEIETVLKKYFTINYYAKEINRTENFINVEDIEHKNESFETINEHDIELISSYQKRHIKHNATEFIELYEEWGYDVDDLNDLELSLDNLMMSIMMDNDFEGVLPDILNILETYNKFLYIFTEFEELSKVVYSIVILLRDINFETLESQTLVSKLVLTTIQDLVEWKERVFIAQDAQDVYYINDPILNSYVQLQDLLS